MSFYRAWIRDSDALTVEANSEKEALEWAEALGNEQVEGLIKLGGPALRKWRKVSHNYTLVSKE